MHSFFLPSEYWPEPLHQPLSLSGPEAHHLSKVLRLQKEEEILLLDGQGREARCRILQVGKTDIILEPLSLIHHPEPSSKVILAAGWGKAARRGWILEKAVELEAWGLWFWQAERSQFPVPHTIKDNWTSQLIAGAKQCHNPWLPALRTLSGGVTELIEASNAIDHKQLLVESTYAADIFLTPQSLACEGVTLCVVGPEGGFAPREIDLLKEAGFTTLTMGERILRWETAALMVLGLHWWKRQMSASSNG